MNGEKGEGMTEQKRKPQDAVVEYNTRRGDVYRKRVLDVMDRMGHDATIKSISEDAGINRVTTTKHVHAIRAGWRP